VVGLYRAGWRGSGLLAERILDAGDVEEGGGGPLGEENAEHDDDALDDMVADV